MFAYPWEVAKFNDATDAPGPTLERCVFDLASTMQSQWNQAFVTFVKEAYLMAEPDHNGITEADVENVLLRHITRLRKDCNAAASITREKLRTKKENARVEKNRKHKMTLVSIILPE